MGWQDDTPTFEIAATSSVNLSAPYSLIPLNLMQVSQQDAHANVRLEWQAVNEQDETGCCDSWRVMVLATRSITPFEPFVRVASSQEEYALHKSINSIHSSFLIRPEHWLVH